MKPIHEKSPCCQGLIRRYGKRRRQCVVCKSTWRVWKRKVGRKRSRVNRKLVFSYFSGKRAVRSPGKIRERRRRKLIASRDYYLANTPWSYPPANTDFILIADGMRQIIEEEHFTVYFLLLRPVLEKTAYILPPLVIPGSESRNGWLLTLESIPADLQKRIKALVCDGETSLVLLAKQRGWLVQRCHFHLLGRIKNYVSGSRLRTRRPFGQLLFKNLRIALTTLSEEELTYCLEELRVLKRFARAKQLKSFLSGLIKHIADYRTYLDYPELNLPNTSNAAESLIQYIRDLQYRSRGFRTIQSFSRWVNAACLFKKTICCNGKYQPRKCV